MNRGNLLGNLGIGNNVAPDPNAAPTPRQKLQVDYLEALYNNKQPVDLRKDERTMLESAFKAGHGVYLLVNKTRDSEIRQNFKAVGRYTYTPVAMWNDFAAGPPDPVADNLNNNGAGGAKRTRIPNAGNGGRAGAGGGGRRGGFAGGVFNTEAPPVNWELIQIKPDTSDPPPVVPARTGASRRSSQPR
jgi:hypothetical protein